MTTGERGLMYELIFEREREIKYMSRRKGKRRVNWETHLFWRWRRSINFLGS